MRRPGTGRVQGGLPLTVRFTESDYAALLRIAASRSTSASHLIEDLVRHALTHSSIPDAREPLHKDRAKRAGDLIADGETDDAIARMLGVTVAAVANYRANHTAAASQPRA
jgi:DNA-binding CsgD family transcriptional regulator